MAAVKKIPQRQCIGCNEMKDKKQLIRILKTQDEQIIIVWRVSFIKTLFTFGLG